MSTSGQSPTAKRIRFTPQATDPVNPAEGDFFHSNGTPRAEGPWVYQNGAWLQISTSGAISTVNDLTFTPQAADPGTPVAGMVFYSNGTSRTAGLWVYDGSGWVQLSGARTQEIFVKDYVQVRVATTAAITLASQLENGDTIDGVVLATGNRVLVKNQVTATENGILVVAASGAPTRSTDADTFGELNLMSVLVNEGTVNKNTSWFQTATLMSLATDQVWAATPGARTFTVPGGVYELRAEAAGGGGGGGGGGGSVTGSASTGGGGGGAGAGAPIGRFHLAVTPGEILSIVLGEGGTRALGGVGSANGATGGTGGNTTITGSFGTITLLGADGASGGQPTNGPGGIGGVEVSIKADAGRSATGGNGSAGGSGGTAAGGNGQSTMAKDGGTGGTAGNRGGSGGGGGASVGAGGGGGIGFVGNYAITTPTNTNAGVDANKGAGGGGGGGGGATAGGSRTGATSGAGGCGYILVDWS